MSILPMAFILLVFHRALRIPRAPVVHPIGVDLPLGTPVYRRDRSR